MKLTIIQNTFKDNPYIRESAILNLKALEESNIDYQYIIFNDHGDIIIESYIKDLINDKVEYYYSPINYGKRQCSGGWLGAINQGLIKGELFQSIGQDDVYSSLFYKQTLSAFSDSKIFLCFNNGWQTNEDLTNMDSLLTPLQRIDLYTTNPREVFNQWFGVSNKQTTRANNYIPHPGVVYKTALHEIIGLPDLETFRGTADFEYWSRVLFNNIPIMHNPMPTWLYRRSKYSAGEEIIDGLHNERDLGEIYRNLIKQKYDKLLQL